MPSAVSYAKANLLAILTTALPGVQVSYAHPGELAEHESVWMADAVGTETATIGQVSHREGFVIPVVVSVLYEGDDGQATEERAWAIVATIETFVLANPSLGNALGVTAAVVTGKTPTGFVGDGSRIQEITVDVTVTSKTPGNTGGPALDIALPLGPVQDEGVALTRRPALDFVGAGVTATDDAAGNRTVVTVPAGQSAGDVAAAIAAAAAPVWTDLSGMLHAGVTPIAGAKIRAAQVGKRVQLSGIVAVTQTYYGSGIFSCLTIPPALTPDPANYNLSPGDVWGMTMCQDASTNAVSAGSLVFASTTTIYFFGTVTSVGASGAKVNLGGIGWYIA